MKKEAHYQKIARAIAAQITRGVWKTGDKLPSLRALSHENGVSLNTAIQAYLQLEKEGYLIARPKSGYLVSYQPLRLAPPAVSNPPATPAATDNQATADLIAEVYRTLETDNPAITCFSLGIPDDALLPIAKLNKELIRALRTLPGNGTRYDETQGNLRLRQYVARFTYSWNGRLTADELVTTAGVTNAVALALAVTTRPGDTLAVESPVYFGLLQLAHSLGLRILELPSHPATGIDPDALRVALPRIQACLVISNFNNPTGSCMPDTHKKAIVDLLHTHAIPLIEDDLYGDLFFGPCRPKPCKAFDREGLVLWCGGVSKTLAPGYRVGWIAPGKYKDALIRQKNIRQISTPTLNQEAIANFMENDRYENHLRKLRRELHTNSLHFIRAVQHHFPSTTRVVPPQGGFMLWLELDKHIDTARLYYQALRQHISIAPGRMFTLQDQYHHCLRLSYGQRWTPLIEDRLRQLGDLIRHAR